MLARILLSLVLCTLAACGSTTRAPVEDRESQQPTTPEHTVVRGDTLYSIAFRYGLDYRQVATANGIEAPFTIYPGQRIRLLETPLTAPVATAPAAKPYPGALPGQASAPPAEPVTPRTAAVGQGAPPVGGVRVQPTPPMQPVPAPTSPAQPAPAPTSPALPVSAPTPRVPPAPAPTQVAASIPPAGTAATGDKVGSWLWPTTGPVTRPFSNSLHKGIDIGGDRGDPVAAVAAGTVVYAGTGIAGFGELLIVKHDEVYISAYGHNDELLVAEGDTVAAGQTIARKGSSGTDTVKLHFEIREGGKPIDPQRVLPRR